MREIAFDVHDFMEAAGQTKEECAELYMKLVEEEIQELRDAIAAGDKVETMDAILDSVWVLVGLGISMRLPLIHGWREVARSNLAKIDPLTGRVLKNEQGKVMKPKGWTPPDLASIIEMYK